MLWLPEIWDAATASPQVATCIYTGMILITAAVAATSIAGIILKV
jgi:hypothetical protein